MKAISSADYAYSDLVLIQVITPGPTSTDNSTGRAEFTEVNTKAAMFVSSPDEIYD